MFLKQLHLTNFKNYEHLSIPIDTDIQCFVGDNGEGKTNILDAIYYVCIGKSYFNSVERQCMLHGTNFLRVEGSFESLIQDKRDEIVIINELNGQKKIAKNKLGYDRIADHLGYAPICFIAPDDNILILGGSSDRRRFLTTSLSQLNPHYISLLLQYRKILKQRNALLKQEVVNHTLLTIYDKQLAPIGDEIYFIRKQYVDTFSSIVTSIYNDISLEKEKVSCSYYSPLKEKSLAELLHENRHKDIFLRRSSVGIHKDDLKFKIDGYSVKQYGSQGQQKTFLLALKLAELNMMRKHSNKTPILLLDDVFDKLDAGRVKELFRYIINNQPGQLFITDTNGERLQKLLKKFDRKFAIFTVSQNQLKTYAKQ